jgi:hypothetical protein
MAEKGEEKGKEGEGKSGKKGMASGRSAASRGVGGGLLLGFSTCAGAAAGKTLIQPLHRLRGIEQAGDGKITFYFDPCKGGLFTATDKVELTIADSYSPGVWRIIMNMISGHWAGDSMVWVYNSCARGRLQEAPVIEGVTAIDITWATE